MAKAPLRTPVPGPAFIRLLARLTDTAITPSSHTLAERLGEWIDWTRAVALSRALDGPLPAAAPDATGVDDSARESARVRASLVAAITADAAPAAPKTRIPTAPADDYAPFRERYLDLQRSMQAAAGRLRGQLRDRLGSGSPQMARLAELDAVMELTLTPREHTLLAAVPALLGHHFERLRADAPQSPADPPSPAEAGEAAPRAWRAVFRQDMQHVLLAELDVRFHPVEGLLAALHAR